MPVQTQEQEKEKVPMFSISELKLDKYAPTSSKDKDIGRTKKMIWIYKKNGQGDCLSVSYRV